jgi:ASC-1-like (ASCH) protein
MNERIKKLAFEAMSINQKVSDDSFFVEVSKLKEFEKFAELMHDECIDAVPTDLDPATYFKVLQAIKQHFGF